jgi:succinate dehydrogenase/fumarate reductase flavoprotein subunit
VIFGLHVGNEGKTRVPIYQNYTQAGFNPDIDMLQVNVMPPDQYRFDPWWMGMAPRHWRALGGAGLVFDWDLRSTLPGLYGAGMQLAFGGDHSSAAATGRYAGRKASEFAETSIEFVVCREQVDRVKERIYAPAHRTSGTGWKELRAGICRIMQDY